MSGFVNIRRRISSFYKTIHPDTTTNFPETARNINSKSLCELNSYIDIFRHGFRCGFVSKKLNFFKPYVTATGKTLGNRIQPIAITLPSIPPEPTDFDLVRAAERLVNNINTALNERSGPFKPLCQSIELPESQNDGKHTMSKLLENEMINEAMLATNFLDNKLLYEINFFFNGIKQQHFKNDSKRSLMFKRAKLEIKKRVSQLIENEYDFLSAGMNLNCLFLKNKLTETEKEIAMENISGKNLDDCDLWLLKNVWHALHNLNPKIPVLIDITDSSYTYSSKYGYIQIPCNFKLMTLIEFLELNLDEIAFIRNNLKF